MACAAVAHAVSQYSQGRAFIGMRDYYHLLKFLRRKMKDRSKFDEELLTEALCRNFSGRPKVLRRVLKVFHAQSFPGRPQPPPLPVRSLIAANLLDQDARHVMILTRRGAALPILFDLGMLDHRTTTVLVGSEFADDSGELQLVQQINMVKNGMSRGDKIVLVNHDNIYEALYDILNQRYLTRRNEKTGLWPRCCARARACVCAVRKATPLQ